MDLLGDILQTRKMDRSSLCWPSLRRVARGREVKSLPSLVRGKREGGGGLDEGDEGNTMTADEDELDDDDDDDDDDGDGEDAVGVLAT